MVSTRSRTSNSGRVQLPLFTPESSWTAPRLCDLPQDWSQFEQVGIDTETRDPYLKELGIGVRRGGYMVGVSLWFPGHRGYYLPIRHDGGDNMEEGPEAVISYLRHHVGSFEGELVGARISYDLDYLAEEGIWPHMASIRDIQVVDPLIYELHRSFSLANISERHGFKGKDESLLEEAARVYGVDPKGGMWALPARYVGAYAERDAELPVMILNEQKKKIVRLGLENIFHLESQVTPVLVKMRRRGVRINQDKLEEIEEWTIREESAALRDLGRISGVHVDLGDVWKASAVAPALEAAGLSLSMTSNGQPQIDKALLSMSENPAAAMVLRARKVNKLRTTFAASIRKYMVNGRIHTTFEQIATETESGDQKGARYGRLSSVDPNLQQQPSRDEFAKMWRTIYEPEEGSLWCSADYSQQEPKWTTHFAAECGFPGAAEAAQKYHDDPNLDNHQFMADITGVPRKFAKNIYLGICYGEGGAKLSRELGLSTAWAVRIGRQVRKFETRDVAMDYAHSSGQEYFYWECAGAESQSILDQFDERAPFISKLSSLAQDVAKRRGYVQTIGGRRLNFAESPGGGYEYTHKALNRIIQGSSADQMKRAMVEIDRAGHFLQLQVHDESDSSIEDRAEAQQIANIMRDVIPARVPFRVDVEIGPSWGEIE